MNSTTSSSQSQSPENPDALLLTWDDVYTGSYGTSLFLILVLTATFAEGILAVRSVPVKIAFWTSVFSSIVRLTVGCIGSLSSSRPTQIFTEFAWALLSSTERYCLVHMLYTRTVEALWPVRHKWLVVGEVATFGVFTISCCDYFWYAISTVPGYDYANYNMPLGLVDSIYLMILDAFFFLHLAKTLRSQNKVLLPSGKVDFGSLSFEVAQVKQLIKKASAATAFLKSFPLRAPEYSLTPADNPIDSVSRSRSHGMLHGHNPRKLLRNRPNHLDRGVVHAAVSSDDRHGPRARDRAAYSQVGKQAGAQGGGEETVTTAATAAGG
ncbi:hypothetical protein BDZ88DRAFT_252260 [Geranomyces variabilis]|nr:hypothetical protein BDZ88DRAFT_252260 [Geranomyces variabilis]